MTNMRGAFVVAVAIAAVAGYVVSRHLSGDGLVKSGRVDGHSSSPSSTFTDRIDPGSADASPRCRANNNLEQRAREIEAQLDAGAWTELGLAGGA